MKRILLCALVMLGVVGLSSSAGAQSFSPRAICDKDAANTCATVDADGQIQTSPGLLTASDIVTTYSWGHNGSAFEETQHNLNLTILASAARTATTNSTDQTNRNGRGVLVTFDVTVIAGTPSLVPVVQCKDSVSGKYEALLTGAAVTAVGTHSYLVYPGAGAASADVTQVAGFPLCRTWRVAVTHGTADSVTYSVGASLAQ